jgi:hypothetical protein
VEADMSRTFTNLSAQKRRQLSVAVICGLLATVLYAIKPAPPAVVRTTTVLATARDLTANEPITDDALASDEVPESVQGDYLLDSPENRQGLLSRRIHLPLTRGTRLTAAMFLGGLDAHAQSAIPQGWTQTPLEPGAVPGGTVPGSRVDLYDKGGKVRFRNVIVFSVQPFEVLFPAGMTYPLQDLEGGTVTLRNPNEQGDFEAVRDPAPAPRARVRRSSPIKAVN